LKTQPYPPNTPANSMAQNINRSDGNDLTKQ
jgi:hypothetical protein